VDGVLLFDGYCGVCTRAANLLASMNRTGRVSIEPMQIPGSARRVGISEDHLLDSVWWLDSSGAVFGGAKAMNAAASAAVGTRLPLWVYRLTSPLQERFYCWFAAHRYKFRGVTPLCEADPARCA
jgi:predicted DCC family thiol-disulfide oxidoreductase YuxK